MTTFSVPPKPHRHDLLCLVWCPKPDRKRPTKRRPPRARGGKGSPWGSTWPM
jgi:hypothetical protein